MSDVVKLERKDSVGVIRLDRPKVNAINEDVVAGLNSALDEIDKDPSVRAAVVTGGDRTFSAATELAAGPTLSLAAAKLAIHAGGTAKGYETELDAFVALFDTADTKHGLE